jgi:urocanate hydratase
LIFWNLAHPSQIPYYGCESRHRIYGIMKDGNFFENPSKRLWELHNQSTRTLRSHRSSSQTLRNFSTSTQAKPSPTSSNASKGFPVGTAQEIQHFLTSHVTINAFGQITSLPSSVDFTKPAVLDPTVPHAPKRLTRLNAEETELAIANALKYFHQSLHSTLRPICEMELQTYGHIYFYHLQPPQHIWAIPYPEIPGKTMEARAMTHMILNNLNPEVAQFPQELITYGGNGAVFSNWAQFHITIQMLGKMNANQCLSMSSGHPQGLFPKSASSDTPSAVISNGMMIPMYSTPEQLDRLYALGVSMYGQMTAGSWMYIGPQGIVHGTTLTVAQAMAMQGKETGNTTNCRGKVFLTSGLGGMSGAQPKAATINGAICVIAEVDASALRKRHEQGWLDEYYTTPEEVMRRAKKAQDQKESISIGYLGNVIELWEYLASTPVTERCLVAVGSDQTSLHNPYNGGYYPIGLTFEQSNELMSSNPTEFKKQIQLSLHRHLTAINAVRRSDHMLFFDYGNAFLLECHRAGCNVDHTIPSYVECIMGPEFFDYGFGPYRWVCTSGDINDLSLTDSIAAMVLKDQMNDVMNVNILSQLRANYDWITSAMENQLVVGSKARILYSDLEGRIECAIRMNQAIAKGLIKDPIVIGRDHHDVSGTDSPWRETANVKDGSNLTADMSVQNVIGDAMRGATWVSLHNGGGTGWGVASNGGFGLVLDGTERAERRAKDMIFFDVANGLTRRARAGNPHAMETIQRLAKKFPDYQPFLPAIQE